MYLADPERFSKDYQPALDYYLENFDEFDYILSANQQIISEFLTSNEYSPNLEQYRQICKLLHIPVKDKIEPKVVEFLTGYLADNNPEVFSAAIQAIETEKQNPLDQLPDYIQMDENSRTDFFNNELFKDQDRAYMLKIIGILVDFKVSTVKNSKIQKYDNPFYKYQYLVQCLSSPERHNLPPKLIKKLKGAKYVRGYAQIPEKAFSS
ncbi:MAG: hypothetical protein WCK98_07405 [bacterium]